MKFIPALLLGVLLLAGCGEPKQAPVKVSASEEYNPLLHINQTTLSVTSIIDEVEIKKVVINRGNCKVQPFFNNKTKLEFGKSNNYGVFCQPLLEVEVYTNKGDWTFNF